MTASHPIFAILMVILAVIVILCLIFEEALIKWEDKQLEKLWSKYKRGKRYRK